MYEASKCVCVCSLPCVLVCFFIEQYFFLIVGACRPRLSERMPNTICMSTPALRWKSRVLRMRWRWDLSGVLLDAFCRLGVKEVSQMVNIPGITYNTVNVTSNPFSRCCIAGKSGARLLTPASIVSHPALTPYSPSGWSRWVSSSLIHMLIIHIHTVDCNVPCHYRALRRHCLLIFCCRNIYTVLIVGLAGQGQVQNQSG